MVKILMFIPHLNMKSRFEKAVAKYDLSTEAIRVELIHVFGTPDSLSKNSDAEIMVARGMTYERLHKLFPEKHIVEIHLSSFDIIDALVKAKEVFHPKKVALCLHNQNFNSLENLEVLCDAEINWYDVYDEESAGNVLDKLEKNGTDVVVAAGTMCGLCDKRGIQRVHIETKDAAIDQALYDAINAARTINLEREKSKMIQDILNHNEDAIIAIDDKGKVLALNNQAYKTYQLSTTDHYEKHSVNAVCSSLGWEKALKEKKESSEIVNLNHKKYYVKYRPFGMEDGKSSMLILTKNTEVILEAETKIRRSLSEKGLTSKYTFDDIIGNSQVIQDNILMAKRYSQVDSNVLIVGETGTGKELFAHSIHSMSRRKEQPFVALNCATLPENLLESELFGYEPGAFSGASKNGKAGLFELAHKGTIFLDEIGEIPITIQAKLLRVLQEKEVRRIGGTRIQPVDVRVLSATNINIEKQIKEGTFRSDLYYRLNLLDINIPTLRERKEDIIPLMDHFMARFSCEIGKGAPVVSREAARMLENYSWPGNIRELRNICERLTVLNDTGEIDVWDIRQLKIFRNTLHNAASEEENKIDITQLALQDIEEKRKQEAGGILKEEEESLLSEETLRKLRARKKKKELAEELGISRTTLWRLMKKQEDTRENS